MNYLEILNQGSQILRANNIKSSNLDCELILSKILNKPREEILINLPEQKIIFGNMIRSKNR